MRTPPTCLRRPFTCGRDDAEFTQDSDIRHAQPKHRKSITTWQDEAVLKELKDISHERGIPQQVLIAEALSYVFAKYRRRIAHVSR
jgi:hypothetical protein